MTLFAKAERTVHVKRMYLFQEAENLVLIHLLHSYGKEVYYFYCLFFAITRLHFNELTVYQILTFMSWY